MEFLKDEDIDKVEFVTETSNDKTTIDAEAETESGHGDPEAEMTSEAWPDQQTRNNREASGKQLRWLHVIGEYREYFFRYHYQSSNIQFYFREENFALCCAPCPVSYTHLTLPTILLV